MYVRHLYPGVDFMVSKQVLIINCLCTYKQSKHVSIEFGLTMFQFQPNEARHKILVDLVHSDYNTIRDQVLDDVEAYEVDH